MSFIAEQAYVKMERVIIGIRQYDKEDHRSLYLYTDRIVTKHRVFPLADVLDLSFRPIVKEGGLLYLHTKQGVFSYQVQASPSAFMDAYRSEIQRQKIEVSDE